MKVTGLMVLLLAVVAMPVMLRFFAWSGTAVAGERGGGAAFVGAAGADALARRRPGGPPRSPRPGPWTAPAPAPPAAPGRAARRRGPARRCRRSGGAGALVSGLGAVLSRAGAAPGGSSSEQLRGGDGAGGRFAGRAVGPPAAAWAG